MRDIISKIFKYICMNINLLKRENIIQFTKFLVVGGSAFLVDFSINTAIVWALRLDMSLESIIANIFSVTIALIYNYILSSRWSFKSNQSNYTTKTLLKFIGVNIFNLIWSSAAIALLVRVISESNIITNVDYIQPLSKFVVTGFMTIVSFVLYKLIVFK